MKPEESVWLINRLREQIKRLSDTIVEHKNDFKQGDETLTDEQVKWANQKLWSILL
jgi:hypothetical protein